MPSLLRASVSRCEYETKIRTSGFSALARGAAAGFGAGCVPGAGFAGLRGLSLRVRARMEAPVRLPAKFGIHAPRTGFVPCGERDGPDGVGSGRGVSVKRLRGGRVTHDGIRYVLRRRGRAAQSLDPLAA